MPTIRQDAEHQRASARVITITPVKPARVENLSLRIVRPQVSAIEYIVETASPGEVVHVDDEDYHNAYLWRSYEDAKTP